MEIVPLGFRELWLVNGGSWCLPVFCDPYSSDARNITHWHVRPTRELLASPFDELRKRFGPCNLGSSKASWYVSADDLNRHAIKASGCDPSQYLKWDKDVELPSECVGIEEIEGPSKVEEKFLGFMFKRAAIDPKLGRYFWGALKEAMLHWFINVQRPIDFELFEVHPTPYRANWKDIMLAKHPGCARIFRKPKGAWHDQLVESGFMEDLGSSDLVAIDGHTKSIYWTLEVEPKQLWLKAMHEAEVARMASKKPGNYLRYYESCIRKRLDDNLRIFGAWIKEIRRPVARLCESPVSGAPILRPISKHRNALPSWHKPNQVCFQPHDDLRIKQGQGREKSLEKKAQEMLQVPDFQQRNEDVRRLAQSRKMVGPGDGPGGGDGVRVPHADEGAPEVIDVLATGENKPIRPGVDGE